ncbi:MAG: hypothetical protein P0S95_06995 [Rhabdochlamydiaceae bacterium]|nr:hypothetical protein [Candidatus Amphrikana amoebophyrae]
MSVSNAGGGVRAQHEVDLSASKSKGSRGAKYEASPSLFKSGYGKSAIIITGIALVVILALIFIPHVVILSTLAISIMKYSAIGLEVATLVTHIALKYLHSKGQVATVS